ncbi:NADPH-dependent 7-cyano-7-deazaguanine reductase QueF [Gilvimarinus polysaccharolyticus]|uniref:NADPH-dependent 7-cyano-7-deazaguanine reductase QueF n=1 Tax=Gilvimarinus polysaccharolyticus TaxID=863921 RepID=UPI0006730FDE|nr:NADPH-dependent 7-cyano-7-deazaguanine reductase QueF [Gilvimarinus polysaccharolyticus]
MQHTIADSPLGKTSAYISQYAPSLLYAIARGDSRRVLGLSGDTLPFHGVDVWTGYELSWLNDNGLPQVAMIEFTLPCDSPNIVESKSIKLYLNSFNQHRVASAGAVQAIIAQDLSAAAGSLVDVVITPLADRMDTALQASFAAAPFLAKSLDQQDIAVDCYHPRPEYLTVAAGAVVTRAWHSDLLKTNCPVTGQPDWASVFIAYEGAEIDPAGLLRYLVSFREHQDFHEHCVERIFCDITARCAPLTLEVYARYTRRGGLDINPYRSSVAGSLPGSVRLLRQ